MCFMYKFTAFCEPLIHRASDKSAVLQYGRKISCWTRITMFSNLHNVVAVVFVSCANFLSDPPRSFGQHTNTPQIVGIRYAKQRHLNTIAPLNNTTKYNKCQTKMHARQTKDNAASNNKSTNDDDATAAAAATGRGRRGRRDAHMMSYFAFCVSRTKLTRFMQANRAQCCTNACHLHSRCNPNAILFVAW